jgi:hypothetical protein
MGYLEVCCLISKDLDTLLLPFYYSRLGFDSTMGRDPTLAGFNFLKFAVLNDQNMSPESLEENVQPAIVEWNTL